MSLEQVTIAANGTSMVDNSPGDESTGYQSQNSISESIRTGIDKIVVEIVGSDAVIRISGPIDESGILFNIIQEETLSTFSAGKNYLYLSPGVDSTKKTIAVTQSEPTFIDHKNGWYTASGERVLNTGVERGEDVSGSPIGLFALSLGQDMGTSFYFRFGEPPTGSSQTIVFVGEIIYEGKLIKYPSGVWEVHMPEFIIPAGGVESAGEYVYGYIVDSAGALMPLSDTERRFYGKEPRFFTNGNGSVPNFLLFGRTDLGLGVSADIIKMYRKAPSTSGIPHWDLEEQTFFESAERGFAQPTVHFF